FGDEKEHYLTFFLSAMDTIIQQLGNSTALYHNAEHTILVVLAGQEILYGKQMSEGNVSPEDWLHYLLALLCHDVGFLRGICAQDNARRNCYHTGRKDKDIVLLPQGCTDASLNPHHVDRSQQFVAEFVQGRSPVMRQDNLGNKLDIDVARIQAYIERTRFPVPDDWRYDQTGDYPGLTRAADLIGQLSDPLYLQKTTALFYEFEEIGANTVLGYHCPDDVWLHYPQFFRNVVYPYLDAGLLYLGETIGGQQLVEQLYENVIAAEYRRRERVSTTFVQCCS
ncbi:MAG: metal-dependent phosphohydrolase, partial [Merismopedia sp. SIO2A8]|nr:metal-dependent phosphohydrolase [Merismopedia sp. SIO2A8]